MAASQPLAGFRILDLSRVMAGPYCASMLADAGAEVIKVEAPERGEDSRHIGPFAKGESAYFMMLNRGKKSITLDLKSARGVELLRRLAAKSDALIENFRPGVARRLGIDYVALAGVNPKLVYASITGFGQTGPLAQRPAYDLIIQAMSGLMSVTGFADGPPTAVGDSICDVTSGMFAAWAITTALLARERTGVGQHLDVAMLDSTFAMLVTVLSKQLYTPSPPSRVGNRHPVTYPVDAFRAKDGWLVLVAISDAAFARLMTAIGKPDLAADPRFRTNADRSANDAALRGIIQAWMRMHTRAEIEAKLEAAEVPCGPVWSLADIAASEHVRARGLVAAPVHPNAGAAPAVPQPVLFGGERLAAGRAPLLGEHNDEILGGLLGLATAEIDQFRRDKVI